MALIKGKQLSQNSIDLDRLSVQTAGHLLVANAGGQLTSVAISGDLTIDNAGQASVAAGAVDASKLADGSITFAKLNGSGISSDLSSSATATELARADAAKSYADGRYTAATQYADNLVQGLDVKDSVRAATTAALTLATDLEAGDTLDTTVTLVAGDRVLVKDQADATENGIYVVAASGAPARAADAGQGDLTGGSFVFVEEGSVNADTGFVCNTDGVPTLGTDDVSFTQFSGGGAIIAGEGLTKNGNTLDVVLNEFTSNAGVDVVNDSIPYVDATDSSNKKLTVAQLTSLQALILAGSGITANSGALTAPQIVKDDQGQTAAATTNDGDSAGVTLSNTPAVMVHVFVNGFLQEVGDAVKTKDCYFSGDGGTTARAINQAVSGDTLYWNGSIAGFQLDTSDKISFVYEAL